MKCGAQVYHGELFMADTESDKYHMQRFVKLYILLSYLYATCIDIPNSTEGLIVDVYTIFFFRLM